MSVWKRTLAAFLSVVLLAGLLPISVFAQETEDDKENVGYIVINETVKIRTDTGAVEKIDDTFTIRKTAEETVDAAVTVDGAAKEVATANVNGETYYRLRDLATAVNGTAAQFNVEWQNGVIVITGEAYDTAALAPVAEQNGTAITLTMNVDGRTVTTSAAEIGGNNYVPVSVLDELGLTASVSNGTLVITTR